MKTVGLLFRLLCSLIMLVLIGLFVQADNLSLSVAALRDSVTPENLVALFSSWNWVSISALALIVLTALRIMNLVWNVAFNLSIIVVLFCLITGISCHGSTPNYLPAPLPDCPAVQWLEQICVSHSAIIHLIALVFVLGWIASSAALRIALTTLICSALWYGLTLLANIALTPWLQSETSARNDIVVILSANPWIPAAILGAFFLIYSILISVFETFANRAAKPVEAPEGKESLTGETDTAPAEAPDEKKTIKTPTPSEAKSERPTVPAAHQVPTPEKKTESKSAEPTPKPSNPAPKPVVPAAKPAETAVKAPAPQSPSAEVKPEDKPAT